jgi:hypothetical protein
MRCTKCGEPWDIDTLHDVLDEEHPDEPWKMTNGRTDQSRYERDYFDPKVAEFRRKGCTALGARCNPNTTAHPFIGELMDLMGNDIDGVEAMIEDFRL